MVEKVEDKRHADHGRPDDDASAGRCPDLILMQVMEDRRMVFVAQLLSELFFFRNLNQSGVTKSAIINDSVVSLGDPHRLAKKH